MPITCIHTVSLFSLSLLDTTVTTTAPHHHHPPHHHPHRCNKINRRSTPAPAPSYPTTAATPLPPPTGASTSPDRCGKE
ncbi:hypothetical protein HanRHA438_Chr01g0010521 [Helianthus annuus]|nr:hypothetical protein HanIR_Chr01g0011281 [Helianthus annuus]KAJ0947021.1 hypothetical protein HanRHA438_Chr01g0010521 [Helianthus annuus]